MSELKTIIELLNALGDVEKLEATIDGWHVDLYEYEGRRIIFEKVEEGVKDDLPFA